MPKIVTVCSALMASSLLVTDSDDLYGMPIQAKADTLGVNHPSYADTLMRLGDALRLGGQKEDALAVLRQALELQDAVGPQAPGMAQHQPSYHDCTMCRVAGARHAWAALSFLMTGIKRSSCALLAPFALPGGCHPPGPPPCAAAI